MTFPASPLTGGLDEQLGDNAYRLARQERLLEACSNLVRPTFRYTAPLGLQTGDGEVHR